MRRFRRPADAVVHAIGLLFDVQSGLTSLNAYTSASKSVPEAEGPRASTYDNITRRTALALIKALKSRASRPALLGGMADVFFLERITNADIHGAIAISY